MYFLLELETWSAIGNRRGLLQWTNQYTPQYLLQTEVLVSLSRVLPFSWNYGPEMCKSLSLHHVMISFTPFVAK